MKRIKLVIGTFLILATGLMPSCTKDFSEFNTDPNRAAAALPHNLLAPAIYDVVSRNNTRALRITNELMQVHVPLSDGDQIHRYIIRPTESDYMWNNWYLQLTNFKDMYAGAERINHKSYMAISLICQVWVSSLITDMFGDVPYFDANLGRENIYKPKFDAQKDIYADMYAKLEEANTLLAANQAIDDSQKSSDPLYNGDISKWRKFGNSLYLRLLMRASGVAESGAVDKIREMIDVNPANYPIFTSNADAAILKYTANDPLMSPFATYRDLDFSTGNSLSEFFINTLNNWNDPRRAVWATKYGGEYIGVPSGFPIGQVPAPRSRYPSSLKTEPLLGNIINYAEVQFILAEAALKGYIAGNPKTYYDAGVENAITMWGIALPTGYLSSATIIYSPLATPEANLEKIITQKYFTFFFTDFQQWYEYRRTGYPALPKGDALQNDGILPTRFTYPVYVQSLNQANYRAAVAAMGGSDDMKTKVWWNK
ncbi:SusD/RagB family nutrient-binding outer membrane lipoprotein [Pedobacter sp. BS3]|uniref:SusD/RagB family nutrient-binding outer membrane lipoprotein n=1 Tax=Pedobacter sp. BS3 TaxID=2567937 RepID=UPI0011EC06E6|nr:SusD/RagB family nutrient-binding outer membrane lipoprotein [Pedobacter sp. BS3]TZF84787.1 SusD/RagB family nutrient-binding outer membrane lipoprotein [Pedobacter sp. BS3]